MLLQKEQTILWFGNAAGLLHSSPEGRKKIGAIASWRDADAFDDLDRLVLEYAEAFTLSDRDVDGALFAQLAEAFSADELVELTAWLALEDFYSKFNHAFRIEGQGFCPI